MKLNHGMYEPGQGRRRSSATGRKIITRARQRADLRRALFEVQLPDLYQGSILRMIKPSQGHSIRTTMSGRSVTSQAYYTSVRSETCIPTEGETDRLGAMVDEVSTDRVKYYGQPFRIELSTPDGVYKSIPDRARLLDSGRWQIVEAKSRWHDFESEAAKRQNILGQLAADALGADYVQEVPENLGTLVFIENVELVQSYRFVRPTMTQEATAARMLSVKSAWALGELADALDPIPANGFSIVCSMMVRRLLSIDLERKIGRDSLVRPVAPLPPFMPGLFDALPPLARTA